MWGKKVEYVKWELRRLGQQSKDVKHYFSTWIARSPYLQWQLQWATLLGECYWLSYCIALLVYCVCCVFVWTFFMIPCSYLVPWYVASQWDHDWVKIMWSSSHKSQKVSSPTFWRGLSITRDKKNENSSFVIDLSSALGTHKLPYCLQQPAQLAQRWHCLVISCIVKVVPDSSTPMNVLFNLHCKPDSGWTCFILQLTCR